MGDRKGQRAPRARCEWGAECPCWEGAGGSVAFDATAEGEDAGVAFGGFSFGDVAQFDVDLGEGGPCEEVVGAEVGGHHGGSEGAFEVAGAHEDHAEAVPCVEAGRVEVGGVAEECGGTVEVAGGDASAGVVEEIGESVWSVR